MSAVYSLLERLDAVRERSSGHWFARCPAHDDQSPSLSIKETDEGRILIHCFAGCCPLAVMNAVGLSMSDLFPTPPGDTKPGKPRWNYRELLEVVYREATICAQAAQECAMGRNLSYEDAKRVWKASERIFKVLEVIRARPY